jgi:hypothetical protein
MWLLHFISDEYIVLLFFIALVAVSCYQRSVVLYSENIVISFFVFITMGFYVFIFNGARQGIACAIYSLAIGPMLERKFFKYLALVLIAFLFHKTAMLMVPVYFIFGRENTFKNNLLIVLIGCAMVLFYDRVLAFATVVDPRYGQSGAITEGGGFLMSGFFFILGIFFLMIKKTIHINQAEYDRFLNMYLFGVMICVVSAVVKANPSGLFRYNVYFSFIAVFLWPIIFKNIPDRLSRFLVGSVFVLGYLAFYIVTTTIFSNLVPYKFNPSVIFW